MDHPDVDGPATSDGHGEPRCGQVPEHARRQRRAAGRRLTTRRESGRVGAAARNLSYEPAPSVPPRAAPPRRLQPQVRDRRQSTFWTGPGATAVTLAASYLLVRLIWGAEVALVLCMVIVVHELGHFTVAYVGGFDLSWPIIVLPLGGAVLMDYSRAPTPDRAEAAAILAGPLAGAIFALAVAPMALLSDNSTASMFVIISVVVNGVNLLPVGILDGGHLARIVGAPNWLGWLVVIPAFGLDLTLGIVLAIAAVLGHSQPPEAFRGPARTTAVGGWVFTMALLAGLWSACGP